MPIADKKRNTEPPTTPDTIKTVWRFDFFTEWLGVEAGEGDEAGWFPGWETPTGGGAVADKGAGLGGRIGEGEGEGDGEPSGGKYDVKGGSDIDETGRPEGDIDGNGAKEGDRNPESSFCPLKVGSVASLTCCSFLWVMCPACKMLLI